MAALKRGGVTTVLAKTHQYTTFTGHFDQGGIFDFYDLTQIGLAHAYFAQHGIALHSWHVPMGLDVEAEAQLTARVAAVARSVSLSFFIVRP